MIANKVRTLEFKVLMQMKILLLLFWIVNAVLTFNWVPLIWRNIHTYIQIIIWTFSKDLHRWWNLVSCSVPKVNNNPPCRSFHCLWEPWILTVLLTGGRLIEASRNLNDQRLSTYAWQCPGTLVAVYVAKHGTMMPLNHYTFLILHCDFYFFLWLKDWLMCCHFGGGGSDVF